MITSRWLDLIDFMSQTMSIGDILRNLGQDRIFFRENGGDYNNPDEKLDEVEIYASYFKRFHGLYPFMKA
jgi:hypothetical protein